LGGVLVAATGVGCKKSESARRVAAGESASATANPTTATTDAATAPATTTDAATSTVTATSTDGATAAAAAIVGDGGAQGCRVVFGPKELPVLSPAFLSIRGDSVEAILDEDGKPNVVEVPLGPLDAGLGTKEALGGPEASGLVIGCAAAGDRVYCPDRHGNVHLTTRAGGEDRVVASARTGSRIAADLLGGSHPAFAYLASRQTSEGWVNEAWVGVDDTPPVRVSEDGAGATAIAFAPHGVGLTVLTVDARAALTAMHARPISYEGGLHLGEDAVVFVGGPGDRRTKAAAVIGPSGVGLGLLPIAKDVSDFGLALVHLDDPPKVDEPMAWSIYPNGLDPAPVAAAVDPGGGGAIWVARARPATAEPASVKILEVGVVAAGSLKFAPRYVDPGTSGVIKEVSLLSDGRGGLLLSWLDGAGSWLERLACRRSD
jgi:hypothetical protein